MAMANLAAEFPARRLTPRLGHRETKTSRQSDTARQPKFPTNNFDRGIERRLAGRVESGRDGANHCPAHLFAETKTKKISIFP